MSKAVRESVRLIRQHGLARDSELGEVIRWSPSDKKALEAKYGLIHKDPEQARKNLQNFQRSADYAKVSTYRRKYAR